MSAASKVSRASSGAPPDRERELAPEPVQFRLVPALPLLSDETLCIHHGRQTLRQPAGAVVRLGQQAQVERAPGDSPRGFERGFLRGF